MSVTTVYFEDQANPLNSWAMKSQAKITALGKKSFEQQDGGRVDYTS